MTLLTYFCNLKLVAAYETVKDESKRRAYDLTYPRIRTTKGPTSQTPQTPHPTPSSGKTERDDIKEATAAIAAILKAKRERLTTWSKIQKVYDDAIFELKRDIRKLQASIKELENAEKAEQVEEAAAKSWSTWVLSPVYGRAIKTDEEREERARERLQRLHSKGFKERDLGKKESQLREQESLLRMKRQEFDDANRKDDDAKAVIEERVRAEIQKEKDRVAREEAQKLWEEQVKRRQAADKAAKERAEKEKKERDAMDKAWREQIEKQQNEARRAASERTARQEKARLEREEADRIWKERYEKQQKEAEKARENAEKREKEGGQQRRKQHEEKATGMNRVEELQRELAEEIRKLQRSARASTTATWSQFSEADFGSTSSATTGIAQSTCRHDGWWPKAEGRRACPTCLTTWNYLLECPSCKLKACPACQQNFRPARRRPYG